MFKNMKTLMYEGKEYKLTEMKPQSKNFALFTLTMPNIGSWGGKWTGDGATYTRTKRIISRNKNIYPLCEEGNYYHNFGDGWGANVSVRFVTEREAKQADKKTKGFCGYEWMVDSILKNGKIK
jgi:hypothetical protein